MNIKAKFSNGIIVRIIAFVPTSNHDVLAVYANADGTIDTCHLWRLTIIDSEYELEQPSPSLPREW